MNFSRDVARQTSCYTYVIEDDDLASLNAFEVRKNKTDDLMGTHFKEYLRHEDCLCNTLRH